MPRWTRFIAALGGLFVALGAGQAVLVMTGGGSLAEVLIEALLIGTPGLVLVYGGYRLRRTSLHPAAYPRVVTWCLGGAGLLLGIVLLLVVNPGGSVDRPLRAGTIGMALGTVAGFAIGVNEARAITKAREAERQAADAARGREVLGYLNSTLRHEVLNGINIIQGTATQLADEQESEPQAQLDVIVARCDDLTDLINDIRPMARTLTGSDEVTAVDLSSMVTTRVDAIRTTYPEAIMTAEVPAEISVQANQGLSHALSNVLVNAIEHNDKDTPRVEVSVTQAAETVRLKIADNGPGIDDSEKEGLFAPETDRDSGFGLYMTQTLVSYFGGELWVADNDPHGTVFTIELPRAAAAPELLEQ